MFVHHSTSKQRGKATGCRWDCFCLPSGKRGEIVIFFLVYSLLRVFAMMGDESSKDLGATSGREIDN